MRAPATRWSSACKSRRPSRRPCSRAVARRTRAPTHRATSAAHRRLGEFSLRRQQGDPCARCFVPVYCLQRDLEQPGRVNALLVSERPGGSDSRPESATARLGRSSWPDDSRSSRSARPRARTMWASSRDPASGARCHQALAVESATGLHTGRLLTGVSGGETQGYEPIPCSPTSREHHLRLGSREVRIPSWPRWTYDLDQQLSGRDSVASAPSSEVRGLDDAGDPASVAAHHTRRRTGERPIRRSGLNESGPREPDRLRGRGTSSTACGRH